MAKVIRRNYDPEKKCGGCNYMWSTFYAFEGQEDEFDDVGLCDLCFMEMIVDSEMEVVSGKIGLEVAFNSSKKVEVGTSIFKQIKV